MYKCHLIFEEERYQEVIYAKENCAYIMVWEIKTEGGSRDASCLVSNLPLASMGLRFLPSTTLTVRTTGADWNERKKITDES